MKRYVEEYVRRDLAQKIILLTGPRQSGKTTLSKNLALPFDYLNMDNEEHMLQAKEKLWDRNKTLLILDEFHKFKNWKRFIKGVYDTEGLSPQILITGSAKLDTFKNVGDSLAGRYFNFRLYPIDIHEAVTSLSMEPSEARERLCQCSGFPEPFLRGEREFYRRWQRTHTEIILQQDLIDVTAVRSIKAIQMLAKLLRTRVGSGVSYTNLARDLQVSPQTIKSWVEILENMYMFFKITPYHKNIARSLLKEPKIFCYDIAAIDEPGPQLENLVALGLMKHLHFLQDTKGIDVGLHYIRTKDGRELDFLVRVDERFTLIEVKSGDTRLSSNFEYFSSYFDKPQCFQLVKDASREYANPQGHQVVDLANWLANVGEYIV